MELCIISIKGGGTMTLQEAFKIPKEFEYSDLTLWEDEYISSLLLNAHLNPHIDDASRNYQFIDDSSQWILNQINNKDSLLDLGCGPGLYTSIFTNSINNVVGVDFSLRSINYAQQEDPNSTYIHQNYLNLDLNETFNTITMIHCEYGSLSYEDRITLLKSIKNHLKADGQFIFDVFTPLQMESFQSAQNWLNRKRSFFLDSPHTEVILNKIFPGNITLRQSTIITDDDLRVFRQWYQHFTHPMIEEELKEAGLRIIKSYDNLLGTDLTNASNTLAFVVGHL